ncbi:MAG: hypothetical protein PF486_11670 [Prolixibacteraceae bacterium]|jgi:hypothetical protein|nr:hypothetical protein [Prolixibacteraceae bacterium]
MQKSYFNTVTDGVGILCKLGGLVLIFTANDDFKPEYTAADIRFSFAHSLSDLLTPNFQLDIFGGVGLNEYATDNFFKSWVHIQIV